ncbi:acyl-CoA dehydrogenase family protein [Mycobacterium vicinigordonae]|uniref:Acyl-CoA/acyl-ACP dehydrogenase n=1 Tax=Mycobacterium vicinigordonae TaxID=1719132 RepID=A0A7D6I7M1_9MYCO|nr:acyl-CoA dehydrogenase family protein [Mycobacterium vicinigordonae]QLL08938.1 acyl-CoA/acyl-ACP dehydrogenase [Mycobacterium vicinigordonae]
MSGNAISFALNDEQNELRRTVRSFLENKADDAAIRGQLDTPVGYDTALWHQMSHQLGLTGLAIPEEFGGQGFTFVELGIVAEELGRCLLPAPYFASVVLAANLIMHSGDDAAKGRYLPGIAAGSTAATVAITEESGRWQPHAIRTRARSSGTGWALEGTKSYVLDGCNADVVFVAARTDTGISLFAVDEFQTVARRPLSTLDPTRRQARMKFDATPAALIGDEGQGWPVLAQTLSLGASALAAEQVGGAQRCLEMAVDYAKVRKQFGKPIGSFQAIRHKCADIFLEVECARGAAYYAVQAAAELSGELAAAASLAKACSSEAYAHAAAANIQIHGGVGFTWEHPAHLFFKRAKSSGHLLGDATFHRGLLADLVGI